MSACARYERAALLLPPYNRVLHPLQYNFYRAHVMVAAAAAEAQGAGAAPAVDAVVGHAVVAEVDGVEGGRVQLARLVLRHLPPPLLHPAQELIVIQQALAVNRGACVVNGTLDDDALDELVGVVGGQRAHLGGGGGGLRG